MTNPYNHIVSKNKHKLTYKPRVCKKENIVIKTHKDFWQEQKSFFWVNEMATEIWKTNIICSKFWNGRLGIVSSAVLRIILTVKCTWKVIVIAKGNFKVTLSFVSWYFGSYPVQLFILKYHSY